MSGLDRAVAEAARVVGCETGDWDEAEGPDSGVGVDHWFGRTTEDGAELTLHINMDQDHWTWQVTSEDGSLDAEGSFDQEPEETLEEAWERMSEAAEASQGALVVGTWTSVWDGGFEVDAPCLLKADLSGVEETYRVEAVDNDGDELGTLDSEHVTLQDGRVLDVVRPEEDGDFTLSLRGAAPSPS